MFEEYKELAKASNWWDSVKSTLAAPGKYLGDAMYSSENKALAKPNPTTPMTGTQARLQAFGAGASGRGNRAVTSTEQFNPDSTTRSGQIAGMQDQYNTSRAMQSSDSDIAAAAYARAQSNPRYKHLLENFDPATASYQIPERDATQQAADPGTKIDDNYTVPDQVDAEEQARAAKYRSQLPARNNIQQLGKAGEHKCTCGACANCRANAGSKDNMRVQDKNPKKVPVKDFEITGEEAWKGVPNVKTKVKSSAFEATDPQTIPKSTTEAAKDYLLQNGQSRSPAVPTPTDPADIAIQKFNDQGFPAAGGTPVEQNPLHKAIFTSGGLGGDRSLASYSSQAGQWLANKAGLGKYFSSLSPTWQAALPALLGAGGLAAGAYGLSHLFGGDDEKRSSANPVLMKSAVNVTDAIKPTAAVAALGALINLVKDQSVLRGAGTGALAGLGGYAGHELGKDIGAGGALNTRASGPAGSPTAQDVYGLGLRTGIGGTSGAGLGAYGGYELAQHLWGDEDEKADFRLLNKTAESYGPQAVAMHGVEDWANQPKTLGAAGGWLAGAAPIAGASVLGALINLIRGKSMGRGAFTGAMTGAGGVAGHQLGAGAGNLLAGKSYNPHIYTMDSDRPSYVAGTEPTIDPAMTAVRNPNAKAMQSAIGGGVMAPAGAVGGAAGGYQIAQAILGDEDKKPKKRKKKKDSVVNKKEASDLLWCANQLVKQAEPSSPYGQMTPPYLQKAIGAVGSGLKDMGQGLSDTLTNRKTQAGSGGKWRTTEVKPSLSSALGAGLAGKGLTDHLGLTTLMGPNPMGNVARVGGNYVRGIYNSLKDRKPGQNLFSQGPHPTLKYDDGSPYMQQPALHIDNILQKGLGPERTPDNLENPVGWQRATGFPVGPEGMANMGDPAKRQQAAAAFNQTLNERPTGQDRDGFAR